MLSLSIFKHENTRLCNLKAANYVLDMGFDKSNASKSLFLLQTESKLFLSRLSLKI